MARNQGQTVGPVQNVGDFTTAAAPVTGHGKIIKGYRMNDRQKSDGRYFFLLLLLPEEADPEHEG